MNQGDDVEGFELLLASGPDREGLSAEIWHQDELVAEVFQEGGELRLQLHPRAGHRSWEFCYESFTRVLDAARKKLLG